MNTKRKEQIVSQIFEWQKISNSISYKDALFALYDDRMITGKELDQLMPLTL